MIEGIHHIELNVRDRALSLEFYRTLASFFPESTVTEEGASFKWSMRSLYVWVNPVQNRFADREYHRKGVGLDHLAFKVSTREEVDRLQEFLREQEIPILYKADWYGSTYYAVYFEDPDRIKLEFGVSGNK